MKNIIKTSEAPEAIGPYSQAIEMNGFLFISGQIPLNPKTGQVEGNTVGEQTYRVLMNIEAILTSAGFTLGQVLKTTCYIKDMSKFNEMNEVYSTYFKTNPPARVSVEVSRLPKDVLIEIDAIASK